MCVFYVSRQTVKGSKRLGLKWVISNDFLSMSKVYKIRKNGLRYSIFVRIREKMGLSFYKRPILLNGMYVNGKMSGGQRYILTMVLVIVEVH